MIIKPLEARSCQHIEEDNRNFKESNGLNKFYDCGLFRICLAYSSEELINIYRFRYNIYAEEINLPQFHANHTTEKIEDSLDCSGYNFAAFQGSEVVGAMRVNFPRNSCIGHYESFLDMNSAGHLHPNATSISTRLIVSPRLRSRGLAVRLCQASYKFGLLNGIRFNFLDCNDHLIRFFSRLGFTLRRRAEHPEYGMGNVMRLDLLDRAHLVRMRSPFLSILDDTADRSVAA